MFPFRGPRSVWRSLWCLPITFLSPVGRGASLYGRGGSSCNVLFISSVDPLAVPATSRQEQYYLEVAFVRVPGRSGPSSAKFSRPADRERPTSE